MLQFHAGRLMDEAAAAPASWPDCALLGDPVAHTLSPRLFTAALAANGVPARYEAIRVAAEELADCLAVARTAGVRGLNITLPHKVAALAAAAQASSLAREVGCANALACGDRGWHAHNTDAPGLGLVLERAGWSRALAASSRPAIVVGAGGAARAALVALRAAGAQVRWVLARRPERAQWARAQGAAVGALDAAVLGDAILLVQATPLGLRADDPPPVDAHALPRDAYVLDLTYADAPSRLLRAARTRGCTVMDGKPLLVAQAALSMMLWFPGSTPLTAMAQAAGVRWD